MCDGGCLKGQFHCLVSMCMMAGRKQTRTNPHHTSAVVQATCHAYCMSMYCMFIPTDTQLNRSNAAPEHASRRMPVIQMGLGAKVVFLCFFLCGIEVYFMCSP